MMIPTYTYVTTCTRCNGWTEMGGDADREAADYEERIGRKRIRRRALVDDARKVTMCSCPVKAVRKPKGRAVEELREALRAAQFAYHFDPDATPPQIAVVKGDPPILVCIEPAPTLRLTGQDGVRVVPVNMLGPVSRMAIAWHIGATPEEAERIGLTTEQGQQELRERIDEWVAAENIEVKGLREDIGPSDPRWGRI